MLVTKCIKCGCEYPEFISRCGCGEYTDDYDDSHVGILDYETVFPIYTLEDRPVVISSFYVPQDFINEDFNVIDRGGFGFN